MTDRKPTQQEVEDSFRGALKDVAAIVAALAPVCKTLDDLLGMIKLAEDNDAQLRLLLREVRPR